MKQITKTFDAYEFKELSDKAKENVRNKYFANEWSEIFQDDFNEDCKEYAKKNGWDIDNLEYSLSYCQGDGLSFRGQMQPAKILEIVFGILGKGKEKTAKFIANELIYQIVSIGNNSRYCYSSLSDIQIEYNNNQIGDTYYPNIVDFLDKVRNIAAENYTDICRKLEKDGYNDVEMCQSDDYIQECSQDNEWLFDINGNLL